MADRKAGPVKPPVIEGVARAAVRQIRRPSPNPRRRRSRAPPNRLPLPLPTPRCSPRPRQRSNRPRQQRLRTSSSQSLSPKRNGSLTRRRPASTNRAARHPPSPRKSRPAHQHNWLLLGGTAIGGALLGTLLTYLFANLVALPSPVAPIADPAPRLLAAEERADGLDVRLSALENTAVKTQVASTPR